MSSAKNTELGNSGSENIDYLSPEPTHLERNRKCILLNINQPSQTRSHTIVSMLVDPHAVQISVDGSCFPNEKRRSGYAGIVIYPDDPTEIEVAFQGFKESTINRMELAACIAAMNWVKKER